VPVATSSAPARAGRPPHLGAVSRRLDPALALAAVPVAAFAVVGWELRWVNEDGFIYFRIVEQLLAGHGPVFNAGERVEAYTSPAWLAILTLARAALPSAALEHLSVALGLLLSVGGLLAACLAALRLWKLLAPRAGLLLPLGAIVVAGPGSSSAGSGWRSSRSSACWRARGPGIGPRPAPPRPAP
jgi:arabinofuranosyltransferase